MTTLEALVSVSQILLRANGRWCVKGIDETLRRDIRATVFDAAKLFRDCDGDICALSHKAVAKLERRATPHTITKSGSVECPHAIGASPRAQSTGTFARSIRDRAPSRSRRCARSCRSRACACRRR